MIVSVGQRCEGVIVSSIVLDELGIFVLRRIFLGAHEEHVLEEVSGSVEGLWIERTPNMHIESRGTLVSLVVLYKEALELVRKSDQFV